MTTDESINGDLSIEDEEADQVAGGVNALELNKVAEARNESPARTKLSSGEL
jgi:hypothetical protein